MLKIEMYVVVHAIVQLNMPKRQSKCYVWSQNGLFSEKTLCSATETYP